MALAERLCLECSNRLSGRADKKFCSDACRVAFHNKTHPKLDVVKKTDKILHNNYAILKRLNKKGITRVTEETLKKNKFDFKHFTSWYRKNAGTEYFYCYDQGYLRLEGNMILLVEKTNGIRVAKESK